MNGRKGPLSLEQIFTMQIKARNKIEIRNVKIGILGEVNRSLWELEREREKFEFKWGGIKMKIIRDTKNIKIIEGNKKLISSFEFCEVAEK